MDDPTRAAKEADNHTPRPGGENKAKIKGALALRKREKERGRKNV